MAAAEASAGASTPGAAAAVLAASVPATSDVWHCYVHKLRTWAPLPDGAPPAEGDADGEQVSLELVRPYLLLLVCVTDGAFLSCAAADGSAHTNVVTLAEPPSSDDVTAFLCRAMAAPRVLNASMRNSPTCVFLGFATAPRLRCSRRFATLGIAHRCVASRHAQRDRPSRSGGTQRR